MVVPSENAEEFQCPLSFNREPGYILKCRGPKCMLWVERTIKDKNDQSGKAGTCGLSSEAKVLL